MDKNTFSVPFTGSPIDLIARLQSAIQQKGDAGSSLTGTPSRGKIVIKKSGFEVLGDYSITGQNIDFVVTKKPWMVSYDQIEKQVVQYIGPPAAAPRA
jgi:hypothetical protein